MPGGRFANSNSESACPLHAHVCPRVCERTSPPLSAGNDPLECPFYADLETHARSPSYLIVTFAYWGREKKRRTGILHHVGANSRDIWDHAAMLDKFRPTVVSSVLLVGSGIRASPVHRNAFQSLSPLPQKNDPSWARQITTLQLYPPTTEQTLFDLPHMKQSGPGRFRFLGDAPANSTVPGHNGRR